MRLKCGCGRIAGIGIKQALFGIFMGLLCVHISSGNTAELTGESNRSIDLSQDNEGIVRIELPSTHDSFKISDIADYDGDGLQDILYSGSLDGIFLDILIIYGVPQFGSTFNLESARKTAIHLEESLNISRLRNIDSGDVNGDGRVDINFLLIGRARIILNDFNETASKTVPEDSDNYISINTFGLANLLVDDLNNDNIDDLIMMYGSHTYIFVLYGRNTFQHLMDLNEDEQDVLNILIINGFNFDYEYTNWPVTADLNGDSYKDLIYWGGMLRSYVLLPDHARYGIDMILSGIDLALNGRARTIDPAENNPNLFGIKRHTKYTAHDGIEDRSAGFDLMNTLGAGDVDGDGYGDLLIAFYKTMDRVGEYDQMQAYSEIYLLYGRKDFVYGFDLDSTNSRLTKFVSPYMDDGMGAEINFCDLNGDGLDDFILGDRNDLTFANEAHRMYIIYGRTSFPDSIIVRHNFDYGISINGGDVGGTGDVNGDGYDDLAMNGVDGCSYIMFGVGEKFSLSNELVRRLPPFYETSSLVSFVDGTQFRMRFKKGRPLENINFHLINYGGQLPDSFANISQGASAISFYDLEFTGMLSAYTLECSFGYSDSLLHAMEINQLDLTISCYDEITGLWSKIPSVIDTLRNLVTFETDHLSLFALADTSNHLISSIDDESSFQPLTYELFQNYPNPFNPLTTIKYQVPKSSLLNLRIYNILGQEVRTLINTRVKDGSHEVEWDGTNSLGQPVSSGIYIYRMTTSEGFADSKKMLLLR